MRDCKEGQLCETGANHQGAKCIKRAVDIRKGEKERGWRERKRRLEGEKGERQALELQNGKKDKSRFND